jgi:hypothetical protein
MSEAKYDSISIKDLLIQIKEWIIYLAKRWVVLLIFALLGGVFGFYYAKSKPILYKATLSFALEDDKGSGGLSGALGLASQFGFDLGSNAGGAFSGANLMELMRSRTLVTKALMSPIYRNGKVQTLANLYIDFNNWNRNENKHFKDIFPPNTEISKFSFFQDSIMNVIYKELINGKFSVSQREKTVSIIYINISIENEIFAKSFVEALARVVSDFYIETKSKKSLENLLILKKQTDSVRTELNNAISGVAAANDNTFNLNPGLNIRRAPSQRKQIDVQANSAILTELIKNLELAKVTLRKETPLIQIIDKPVYPLEVDRFSKKMGALIGIITALLIVSIILLFTAWSNERTK